MKLLLFTLLLSMAAHGYAMEVCVVGASISHDAKTDSFSYIIDINDDDKSKERSIVPLNESVAKMLTSAAEEMKTDSRVCLQGSLLKISKDHSQFMAYSAKEILLPKLPSQLGPE